MVNTSTKKQVRKFKTFTPTPESIAQACEGFTQEEIADLLYTSQPRISNYLTGAHAMSPAVFELLCIKTKNTKLFKEVLKASLK